MDVNVGATDRTVRTAIGAIAGLVSLAVLAGQLAAPALVSPVLGLVAIIMLATAATSMCPIYSVLGMSTCPRESAR